MEAESLLLGSLLLLLLTGAAAQLVHQSHKPAVLLAVMVGVVCFVLVGLQFILELLEKKNLQNSKTFVLM